VIALIGVLGVLGIALLISIGSDESGESSVPPETINGDSPVPDIIDSPVRDGREPVIQHEQPTSEMMQPQIQWTGLVGSEDRIRRQVPLRASIINLDSASSASASLHIKGFGSKELQGTSQPGGEVAFAITYDLVTEMVRKAVPRLEVWIVCDIEHGADTTRLKTNKRTITLGN
jgi:hypothetical protein